MSTPISASDQPIMMTATPTQEEESTTVGMAAVALSSSPIQEGEEENKLGAIPEEALEVGTEKGIACKYWRYRYNPQYYYPSVVVWALLYW